MLMVKKKIERDRIASVDFGLCKFGKLIYNDLVTIK